LKKGVLKKKQLTIAHEIIGEAVPNRRLFDDENHRQ
jgi:hypothetical protein